MTTPRVTILIPNFNNGRSSSASGELDLIGDLLQSLWDTLHDDPTPFELMVNDDASTDDSIETLRAWAQRKWPNGEPFLTLVESPHEGFISKSNNRMYAGARGDILVRLDGDIVCTTRHWVSRVVNMFDAGPPRLGILGPMQLLPDGRVHACGDMILHPRGYHHVDQGKRPGQVTLSREVDHTMGCFYCCKRELFEDVGGYDEGCLRGETEDFTMMARLKGWSCWTLPKVRFVHRHGLRKGRASQYDNRQRIQDDLDYFRRKWGFCRLAPDLRAAAERWRGTPLLWNAEVFGNLLAGVPDASSLRSSASVCGGEALKLEETDWGSFAQDDAVRRRVELPVSAVRQLMSGMGMSGSQRVAVIDMGDGVTGHLLAKAGIRTTQVLWGSGVEPRLAMARRCVRGGEYPAGPPRYVAMDGTGRIPLGDAAADLLLMDAAMTAHPNPVGLLSQAQRLLAPDGVLAVLEPRSRWQLGELMMQVGFIGGWQPAIQPTAAGERFLAAWRREAAAIRAAA